MAVTSLYGFRGLLNASISRSAGQLTLAPGYVVPTSLGSDHSYAVISAGCEREVVRVAAISGDVVSIVRGQGGTVPRAFPRYSTIEYEFTYAEAEERVPYFGAPTVVAGGSVTVDGAVISIPDIRMTGVDFLGDVIGTSPDATGCCVLPSLRVPLPEEAADEYTITGDAYDTNTYPSTPNYLYAYTITGGTGPHVVTLDSGAGPPGLVLGADGRWTGRPTATGVYNFVVKTTDYWGVTATVADSITVVTALSMFGAAPDGVEGEVYAGYQYGAAGGTPPYTFDHVNGTLPPILAFSTAGALDTAITTTQGVYTFDMEVTDDDGNVASHSDTIQVVEGDDGGPGTYEDHWFAALKTNTGGSITDFVISIHRLQEIGTWAEQSSGVAYAPHSFRSMDQRLFGVRMEVRGPSTTKVGGPVYSDDYGVTWQLGTFSGDSTVPLDFDAIHITNGVAYTPANGPETNAGGNFREVYWKTSDGASWTTVRPHRAVLYALSETGLIAEMVHPTDMDLDVILVGPNAGQAKLGRYGRIRIYFVRRALNRTYIGVRIINNNAIGGDGPGAGEPVPGFEPGEPPETVPDNMAEFGGIFWNDADVTGTDDPDHASSWKGGVVAPFQNMVVLGNRLVTAWDSLPVSVYDPENPPGRLPAATTDVAYSDDGGLTFAASTFTPGVAPYMVEPRSMINVDGTLHIIGYRSLSLGTSLATRYTSTDGITWSAQETMATTSAGFMPQVGAALPYADTGAGDYRILYKSGNVVSSTPPPKQVKPVVSAFPFPLDIAYMRALVAP